MTNESADNASLLPSIASKVESAMERDEGCLLAACTRSLVAVTESTGVCVFPLFIPVLRLAKIHRHVPNERTVFRNRLVVAFPAR